MSKEMFVLLGGPCSGKGTQMALLTKIIPCVAIGDILRKKYPEGTIERKKLDNGEMLDVDVINKVVADFIKSNGPKVLIDGYPRTEEQANFLSSFVSEERIDLTAIVLHTNEYDVLEKRMKNRRYCAECQKTYNRSMICCKKRTKKRNDDNEETFKRRFEYYMSTIDKITNIVGSTMSIDATNSIEDNHKVILNIIK